MKNKFVFDEHDANWFQLELTETLSKEQSIFMNLWGNSYTNVVTREEAENLARNLGEAGKIVRKWSKHLKSKKKRAA